MQAHGVPVFLAAAGVVLLWLTWAVVRQGSDAPAAVLATLGGGALLAAPFADRIAGLLKIGPIEMTIRERALAAVAAAPEEAVRGVLPFLESARIGVGQVVLEPGGLSLGDDRLRFIRRELGIQVVAVRVSGQSEWSAGGEITDLELPAETQLLVVGPRTALPVLRDRLANLPSSGAGPGP